MLGEAAVLRCFYDLDTPVTLDALETGGTVSYLGTDGLAGFDLVLSYTGGGALDALRARLGARRVEPLYGWADEAVYRPTAPAPQYKAALSYLGTYAADRQEGVARLLLEPARLRTDERFVIGGAQYPKDFPWGPNIFFVRHLPPSEHPSFFAASRLTLNVTRAAMARMGWCPSGRLFEAACCGTPVLSDRWEGIESFFEPGAEMLVADGTKDALAALDLPAASLAAIGRRARARALGEHTAAHRAARMIALFKDATA